MAWLFDGGFSALLPGQNAATEVVNGEALFQKYVGGFEATFATAAINGNGFRLFGGAESGVVAKVGLVYVDVYGVGYVPFGKFFGGVHIDKQGAFLFYGLLELLHILRGNAAFGWLGVWSNVVS